MIVTTHFLSVNRKSEVDVGRCIWHVVGYDAVYINGRTCTQRNPWASTPGRDNAQWRVKRTTERQDHVPHIVIAHTQIGAGHSRIMPRQPISPARVWSRKAVFAVWAIFPLIRWRVYQAHARDLVPHLVVYSYVLLLRQRWCGETKD